MGIELSVNEFSLAQQSGLAKPIIYCCSCGQVEKEAVSISVALTKELKELRPSRRTMQLEKCFCKIRTSEYLSTPISFNITDSFSSNTSRTLFSTVSLIIKL